MISSFWKVCAILATFAALCHAEESDCQKSMDSIIQQQLDSFKTCLNEVNFETKEERNAKMMCVLKCTMRKEGFLEADGTVNIANSLAILNNFNKDVQSKIVDYLMTKCQQYAHDIDPKDETCKTYEPMIKCAHAMVNQVCK